jgi:hypothetical protein
LLKRTIATRAREPDEIPAAGVYASPSLDPARLQALFAAADAPGRGDLAAFKKMLCTADRRLVADSAQRAADHLRIAFHMWDKQKDHQRSGIIRNWLEPAPFTNFVTALAALVAPPDEAILFHNPSGCRPDLREALLCLATEARGAADAIINATPELTGIDTLCGIDVKRIVNDLKKNFEPQEEAARRIVAMIVAMRDNVALLGGYSNTLDRYLDVLLSTVSGDRELEANYLPRINGIIQRISTGLHDWCLQARANLGDGVVYASDVKRRLTGISRHRRLLPDDVLLAPTRLVEYNFALMGRPEKVDTLDTLVRHIAGHDEATLADWLTIQNVCPLHRFFSDFDRQSA